MRSRPARLHNRPVLTAMIGAVAAAAASAVMLWGSQRWGGTLPAQALSDHALSSLPLTISRRVLLALGANAKPLAFMSITLTQSTIGMLIALTFARFARSGIRNRIVMMLALAVAHWLMWSAVAAPLAGLGWFASAAPGGTGPTQATLVAGALTFGMLTALLLPWPGSPALGDRAGPVTNRRQFVTALALVGLIGPSLLSAAYLGRYARRLRSDAPSSTANVPDPASGAFSFAGMPPAITPTSEFYVVSKNFVDPSVDATTWTLRITGLVEQPLELSYSDILRRDAADFVSTLICISNTVGGPYVSTAVWTGFPLRELLLESGVQPGAVDLELHASDGYVESLPIEKALAPDTMLVHSMNGEPLTGDHGYPARLIVPGRYGIKNVKWLTRMHVVAEDVRGYWQERHWSEMAYVETTSRIDTPRRGRRIPFDEVVRIGGMAFAGDRGISRVEFSLDDGATWFDADLMDELSPLAWRLWKHEYTPPAPGIVKIAVRATDSAGSVQSPIDREPLPEGATGYHRAWFEVRERDAG